MAWYNKLFTQKSPTNPYSQKMIHAIPGTSLITPAVSPQPGLSANDTNDGFLSVARYARALKVGGAWWDLFDNHHSSTGFSIYDLPD